MLGFVLGLGACSCNLSPWEAETGGVPGVGRQLGLWCKTLSGKTKLEKTNKKQLLACRVTFPGEMWANVCSLQTWHQCQTKETIPAQEWVVTS